MSLKILDRCILRPSRHELASEGLVRFEIDHDTGHQSAGHQATGHQSTGLLIAGLPIDGKTEAYVFTNSSHWAGTSPRLTDCGPPPRHLVLKFPGTGGRAERSSEAPMHHVYPGLNHAEVAQGEHVEVWTWNPPGYGRSTPSARIEKQIPFAQDFARQVTANRCGPNTIVWLAGNSLGCVTSLALAASRSGWFPGHSSDDLSGAAGWDKPGFNRIGLWCRNPPDLRQVILRIADRYRARRWMNRIVDHLPDDMDAVEVARWCPMPAVFLASQHDSLVPLKIQSEIHRSYAGPHQVVILDGLDHDGVMEEQHVSPVQSAANWLLQQTGSGLRT